jgi:hypothetical protein
MMVGAAPRSLPVVITALENANAASLDGVQEAVLPIDASRPDAAQVLEQLGFAGASERRPADFFNQPENPRRLAWIRLDPKSEIVERLSG